MSESETNFCEIYSHTREYLEKNVHRFRNTLNGTLCYCGQLRWKGDYALSTESVPDPPKQVVMMGLRRMADMLADGRYDEVISVMGEANMAWIEGFYHGRESRVSDRR